MTWGWDARGALPVDAIATGTTGGGSVGAASDSATKAWPRYEAEYLKRALQSERYKYDTEGLDEQQKSIYLDRVTEQYKTEADECLKAEFEQWLQGMHACNDPENDQTYGNAEGKPVRRWVSRSQESTDVSGHSKVGQARVGWKHTPWGRATLTGLPGVRDYLRTQKERANEEDLKMQLLAEYGPQNIDQSWMYFKHWVKGRPLSDAVALAPRFETIGQRSDYGNAMPDRMYDYDAEQPDRQPGVLARDANAFEAGVAKPSEPPVQETSVRENANYLSMRALRDALSGAVGQSAEATQREVAAEQKDVREAIDAHEEARDLESQQRHRQAEVTGPVGLTPAL